LNSEGSWILVRQNLNPPKGEHIFHHLTVKENKKAMEMGRGHGII
jgi:hypothetical protein